VRLDAGFANTSFGTLMPNTATAKKRLRQNVARRDRNRSAKSALRTQIRKLREAITVGNLDTCQSEFRATVKRLDKAAAKKIIHANRAARLKSRMSAAIKKVKSGAQN
jgi:small subunit ribosomal protein S20